jgi:hypothetical protein
MLVPMLVPSAIPAFFPKPAGTAARLAESAVSNVAICAGYRFTNT